MDTSKMICVALVFVVSAIVTANGLVEESAAGARYETPPGGKFAAAAENHKLDESAPAQPPTGDFVRDSDGDSVKKVKAKSEDGDEKEEGADGILEQGSFGHAFIATLSVIIVSELGDKTFFIAAIMAMRHARATVFAGAILALGVMHVMSSLFGFAITVVPRVYTYYLSSFLFAVFGLKMLREGWKMSGLEAAEEMEEVQEDLKKKEAEAESDSSADVEGGRRSGRPPYMVFFSRIFIQSFTMTFLAEWGDRSQLATIVLAAREEIIGVIIGGVLGHALCTGLAVLGGRMIATRISVRTVTLAGGVVFLFFALTAFFMDPDDL